MHLKENLTACFLVLAAYGFERSSFKSGLFWAGGILLFLMRGNAFPILVLYVFVAALFGAIEHYRYQGLVNRRFAIGVVLMCMLFLSATVLQDRVFGRVQTVGVEGGQDDSVYKFVGGAGTSSFLLSGAIGFLVPAPLVFTKGVWYSPYPVYFDIWGGLWCALIPVSLAILGRSLLTSKEAAFFFLAMFILGAATNGGMVGERIRTAIMPFWAVILAQNWEWVIRKSHVDGYLVYGIYSLSVAVSLVTYMYLKGFF